MRVAILMLLLTPMAAAARDKDGRSIPFQTMTFDEVVRARAAGTGCTWLGGGGFTRRVSMKEDRAVLKRDGRIVVLRPAADAREAFPYTYRRWTGGGLDIAIHDIGKQVARVYEHVETVARLTLTEKGRSWSWTGRLNCGS